MVSKWCITCDEVDVATILPQHLEYKSTDVDELLRTMHVRDSSLKLQNQLFLSSEVGLPTH